MALINGALQIGRSAIAASQAALSVTGNNMANAATPGYSRQVVHLTPTQYTEVLPGKYTGTGVAVAEIHRQVDDALNGRIRTAVGDSASYLIQQQTMTRVEAAFNELTGQDLSSRLNSFFNAFSALQKQPQDMASRNVVLQEGDNLSSFMKDLRGQLSSMQDDLDSQVRLGVKEANSLADQIAQLNQQVVVAEAGRAGSAAALRDQRDELLKQLSGLVNIHTREMEGGAVTVFIGNDPLIQYGDNIGLTYKEDTDAKGDKLAQVVFTGNSQPVSLSSGKLHGLITARDDRVGAVLSNLDSWTSSLILEVNKLNSLGQGLDKFGSVTSDFAVEDADASLADTSATSLPWAVNNGVFGIQVYDANGKAVGAPEMVHVKIGIDGNDSTLNTLAADINSRDNLNATVDGAGKLHISAENGYSFGFVAPADSKNTTNVMAALGINSFFAGKNASDIAVHNDLISNPRLLAASSNGLPGNGEVAGKIAELSTKGVSSLQGISLPEKFSSMVGKIATQSKSVQDNYKASDVVVQSLSMERQSISGVSTDEEAMNMVMYQRSFQGAARYVSLIDQMLNDVMGLLA